jgi:hypothetical protein
MPLEAKVAPRPAKVAGRLYPTHAHRVNYAWAAVLVSFGMGIHSIRRSFPSRHGGRNPVRRQHISKGMRSGFPLSRE